MVASCRSAVMVWPEVVPAASSCRAAASGGRQACVHAWSEVGAPMRPVLPTPWTLKLSESPSSPRPLPALTTTLVRDPGTTISGASPTKPLPHEVPTTSHEDAAALQAVPWQDDQEMTQLPWPSAAVLTDEGAPGPVAVVTKSLGSDAVACLPM